MKENRWIPTLGAVLWILGLAMFIVGLNIHSGVGSWFSIIGNILFLFGLGLEGVWWFKKRNQQEAESSGSDTSDK